MIRPFRQIIPLLVVALGLAFTFVTHRLLEAAYAARLRADFARLSQTVGSVIDQSLRAHEEALYSLRNLYHYSSAVSPEEFTGISADLLARHPGILALEWAERVTSRQRAEVEHSMRAAGFMDFEFKARGNGTGLGRAPDRDEHVPVLYIHPFGPIRAALGFDLASSPLWPEMEAAAQENRLYVSGRVPLITDGSTADDWGYILQLPVYLQPVSAYPADWRERFAGFVVGIFRPREIIEVALGRIGPQGFDLLVLDSVGPAQQRTLHYRSSPLRAATGKEPTLAEMLADPLHQQLSLPLSGRNWELHFRPAPEWLAQNRRAAVWIVPLGGVLGSVLLGLYLHGALRRSTVIEQQVRERTRDLEAAHRLLEEDIRQRVETERRLRESESRLQTFLDHSPNSIFVKDASGRYLLCNQQFSVFCRRPVSEIIGRTDEDLFPAEEAAKYRRTDSQVLRTGAAIVFEDHLAGPDRPGTSLVQKFPIRDAHSRISAIGGIATDISERKLAEVELQENRRQLSNLISQLPGAAFRCLFDDKLTALFASEGMLTLTGYPAEDYLAGRIHIAQLTVPVDRPAVRAAVGAAIRERRTFEVEYRLTHRSDQEKWVLVRGRPIYDENGTLRFLEGLAIDITALKHAEQEKLAMERRLLAAQKLESLGVLAGGIAHDFNNILTAVLGNATLARHAAAAGRPIDRSLEQIEHAARRAADLCQQMLAYAGKGQIVTAHVDLSALVRDTSALIEVSISKNTRLELDLADGLPPVLGDETQLRQIVMNLVINAADAIGTNPGRIAIRTYAREADAALLRSALGHPELPAGTYAGLEVTDNGCGMTPETLARIFEPFFTTKFSGRGLGLSAVLGIVQSHHGALYVESTPGVGSTFRLLLPAKEGAKARPIANEASDTAAVRLRGTVLIIDDEPGVRDIAAMVMETHGATVLRAASGEEALAILRDPAGAVSLVLLDMTMPGMGGEEALRRLREIHPRLPVILMSGYSEN